MRSLLRARSALLLFQFHTLIAPVLAGAPFDIESPTAIQNGQDLFNQACSNCHGENGGAGLVVFQGRNDLTADRIFEAISDGRTRGSVTMPAWKESLSETERWELTAFIVSQTKAR